MSTIVAYYTFTGSCEKYATDLAKRENADLIEIKDVVKPSSKLKVLLFGCPKAIAGKPWDIEPLAASLDDYDKIIVVTPIWAGNPVPPINRLFELIPSGKEIEVITISAGGKSKAKDRVSILLNSRGCKAVRYKDVKKS